MLHFDNTHSGAYLGAYPTEIKKQQLQIDYIHNGTYPGRIPSFHFEGALGQPWGSPEIDKLSGGAKQSGRIPLFRTDFIEFASGWPVGQDGWAHTLGAYPLSLSLSRASILPSGPETG